MAIRLTGVEFRDIRPQIYAMYGQLTLKLAMEDYEKNVKDLKVFTDITTAKMDKLSSRPPGRSSLWLKDIEVRDKQALRMAINIHKSLWRLADTLGCLFVGFVGHTPEWVMPICHLRSPIVFSHEDKYRQVFRESEIHPTIETIGMKRMKSYRYCDPSTGRLKKWDYTDSSRTLRLGPYHASDTKS